MDGAGEAGSLSAVLLDPQEAESLAVHGATTAAVLIALLDWPRSPRILFTERRHDLRRHGGEISFPGGRQDPDDPTLTHTALREAHEEIALEPGEVSVVGALPPVGTFVTSYRVHPFVGLASAQVTLEPNPAEVAALLSFGVDELRQSFEMRRLIRRGVPFRTPTYELEGHLIWGATARILESLLERLPR